MIIPEKFKVAGFEVTVDLVDKTDDNNFGYWDDVNNTIVIATAVTEDGRSVSNTFDTGAQIADNQERMRSMIEGQICKTTGIFNFRLDEIVADGELPFMSASAINAIRRQLAEELESIPCIKRSLLLNDKELESRDLLYYGTKKKASYKYNISNHLSEKVYRTTLVEETEPAYELSHAEGAELMRTKYCIRYELGMCPVHQGAKSSGQLFLLNNGQRFSLHFDCKNCEMIVKD